MAGKDLRMTAIFSIKDQLSPVIQKLSKRWQTFRGLLESDNFKNLNRQFRQFRRSLTNVTDQIGSAAGKLALPLTAAAGAVGFSLNSMMSKFLSVGDGIDKASIRLGIGAEKLQNLRYAATMSGGSAEILDKSLAKLGENLSKAASGKNQEFAELMKKLGINLKDANGNLRSAADILPEFAEGIKRNTDAGLRARMMIAAFGEEGQKLIPALEGGAEGLRAMEERAKALGIAMSAQDVKAAADLGDRFSELGMVFDSFGNTLSAKIAPVLSPIINDLTEFIAQNKEAFSNRVAQAVSKFAETLKKIDFKSLADTAMNAMDTIGRFFDSIGGFETVLKAIAALFGAKMVMGVASFVSSLTTLGSTFLALIPLVKSVGAVMMTSMGPVGIAIAAIGAAVGLVIANWDTIGPYFSELWDTVSGIFNGALNTIKNYFKKVFDSILGILTGLFDGDIPKVIESFGALMASAFNLLPDSFLEAGKKLLASVSGIIGEIGRKFKDFFSKLDLKSMMPDSVTNAFNWTKDLLGFGDSKEVPAPAAIPSGSVYGGMAVAGGGTMQGTMKIEVSTKDGATAEITEARSSDNMKVTGTTGHYDPNDPSFGN